MLVEIWSDVVCPWCAIGRARLVAALESFTHRREVEIVYRSFELDPVAPMTRSGTMAGHLATKYDLSAEKAQRMTDHLVEVAALDGLEFRFDRARPGNTFAAHRLLQLALEKGCQHELVGAFMDGYFRDGLAVGDSAELAGVATDVGLSARDVETALESDLYANAVRADEARAQRLEITGVPFVLIEGRFAIPGAQTIERFGMALDRAWAKLGPT